MYEHLSKWEGNYSISSELISTSKNVPDRNAQATDIIENSSGDRFYIEFVDAYDNFYGYFLKQ